METPPFKSELRLIFQGTIPIATDTVGSELYNELKVFLLSWDPNVTLNGQIIKMLEPCCNKKPKGEPDASNSKTV